MWASFSPDDKRIATAAYDSTARVWDAASGAQQLLLAGHGGEVVRAKFSPDGQHVLTASFDTTGRIWDVGPSGVPSAAAPAK